MMKDRYKTMTTKKKQLTVKPEYDEFLQAVDEYTTQIPLVIRQQFRQALHSEYEGDYQKVEEICRDMLAGCRSRSIKRRKRPYGRFWRKNRTAILSV